MVRASLTFFGSYPSQISRCSSFICSIRIVFSLVVAEKESKLESRIKYISKVWEQQSLPDPPNHFPTLPLFEFISRIGPVVDLMQMR